MGPLAGDVTGVTDQCFLPDRHASRAETAAALQRLLAPDATATRHPFADVGADWQQAPVQWMWENAITTGRTARRFAPDEPVTRGALLTSVWRRKGTPPAAAPLLDATEADCLVATGTCAEAFGPGVVAEIEALAAGRRVTARVDDHRTGCTYELPPGWRSPRPASSRRRSSPGPPRRSGSGRRGLGRRLRPDRADAALQPQLAAHIGAVRRGRWVGANRRPTGPRAVSPSHLAVYGTLMPGAENHWLVRSIAGDWRDGHVAGWTYPIGFGPAEGHLGLTLDPVGVRVPVAVLTSDRLDLHWREIDDFEGPGYRRVECDVELADGRATTVRAWIYETDPEAE